MQVSTEHLVLDEKGVARIDGSRIKVMHVAMRAREGLSAQQIHEGYSHLSLAQIHAALAYYYDNQATIDEQITQSDAIADNYFSNHDQADFIARLRERAKN